MNAREVFISIAAILASFAALPSLPAQQPERKSRENAPLVVEGTVRQLFRGAAPDEDSYLVQIEVSRSEARKPIAVNTRAQFPGPGETIYVHLAPRAGKALLQDGRRDIPAVGSQVRAFLFATGTGSWEGATAEWFDLVGDRPADSGDQERDSTDDAAKRARLGMTTEPLKIERRLVLRVASVDRGGPAQSAGLEVGDVIAAIDGAEITSANQLAELAAQGKKVTLVVVDVNTGRGARVEFDPRGDSASEETPNTNTPAPTPTPRISLGLSAEPVTLGMRSALKVIRVDPDGPAAKAGLEPGDIVVAANGTPTTGVEQLLSALRKSGPILKLTVRDSRSGKNVDIDVKLADAVEAPLPEADVPVKAPPGKLGIVSELAFHNNDFAVKVTEVDPGSPADFAGLRPGVLIVAANGKQVRHPNDLNDAVRQGSGSLKLQIVDPTSGKKRDVDLNLK